MTCEFFSPQVFLLKLDGEAGVGGCGERASRRGEGEEGTPRAGQTGTPTETGTTNRLGFQPLPF